MGLELLTQADMVLDACGRFQAPPGFKFVDLPRAIPVSASSVSPVEGPGTTSTGPFTVRTENRAKTLFLCDSIGVLGPNQPGSFKVKWPNGRYLQQSPAQFSNVTTLGFPVGVGANQFAFENPQPVEAGGRITIEMPFGVANIQLCFWGRLRFLLKDSPGGAKQPSCIVGYPAYAEGITGQQYPIEMMDDPREELQQRPRYCGPNGNIMAPETFLGNQCQIETPAGYYDEPYTFFSDPISVTVANPGKANNGVLIPGDFDVVLRRIRPISTWAVGVLSGWPAFTLRTPSGYSMMGGDQVPTGSNTWQRGLFQWLPVFPTLWMRAGDRIIMDVTAVDATGVGAISTVFEYDAVKRRKL